MPNDTVVFPNPQATRQLDGEIPGGEAFGFREAERGMPSPVRAGFIIAMRKAS